MKGKGYKFTSRLVKDISSKTFSELRRRADLNGVEVRVGLPAGKKHKDKKKAKGKGTAKPEEPTPIALIGMVHEFGSQKVGIPERPWLRPGIRSGTPEYVALNRVNLIRILRGELAPRTALALLGAMAVGKVQRFIRQGFFQPLSESTVKGKGSSAPLIDTGQMIQSVVFEVGEKDSND